MSGIPHELIRQVQISTRAAAKLSDYDPSDSTLPELPSLSSEIAASDLPPHLRCQNCKGRLLRGSDSIICLYCGRRPNYDVLPEPISFTSTVGYKWLLGALRLDGSEMVDPRNKSEQDQGHTSSKALIPLSDFLDFKIHWPAETGKQATSISGNLSKESRSFGLTGVDPVNFFSKLNKDVTFDPSIKKPVKNNIGTADKNSAETPDQQNLFQNVQSFEPNHPDLFQDIQSFEPDRQNLFQNVQSFEPVANPSQHETIVDFSKWEADFQFAGSQNQVSGQKSEEHFADVSADSGNNFDAPKSMNYSVGAEVDLSAQIDSVFGPGKDINDEKPKENPAAYPVLDDLWNNLSSSKSHSADGFSGNENVITFETSRDLSTSADLLQDFQLQPHYADASLNGTMNAEHKTMNLDSFGEWNEFTGFSSSQGPLQASPENQFSTSDKKSPETDLFNFDSKFEYRDFGSFSQPDLISAPNSSSNSIPEMNSIMPDNRASIRSKDPTISPSDTSGQPANSADAVEKPTKDDDVKMLVSQMHDLSFMLETDIYLPSSDTNNKN